MDLRFQYSAVEQLRLVYQNIVQLLEQRGYQVKNVYPDVKEELAKQFIDRTRLALVGVMANGSVRVIFTRESTLGISSVQPYLTSLQERPAESGILVVRGNLSPHAKKACDLARRVQLFHEHELLFNPTTHIYAAREHQLVTLKDIPAVITSSAELPRLRSSDPTCRWLGLRPGQILSSQILTDTNGPTTIYRAIS